MLQVQKGTCGVMWTMTMTGSADLGKDFDNYTLQDTILKIIDDNLFTGLG